jgi:hypothetical protein
VKYKDILEPLLEQLEIKRVSKFEEDWKNGVSIEEKANPSIYNRNA